MELEAKRIRDIGNRSATLLTNGLVRLVVADDGGMIPELSYRRDNGYLNTHWVPHFRSNSGRPYSRGAHGSFWGGSLLYGIAGNFPCLPTFGAAGKAYGADLPVHGPTANEWWRLEKVGVVPSRAAFAVTSMAGVRPRDLSYRKWDLLLPDHPVHYTVIKVKNNGRTSYRINAAWHNTIGSPFLEKGCLIDLAAERYATVPSPNEFDPTGRLAAGVEFGDLSKAPLRSGKKVDLRVVPGMIGYTDFITGPVPNTAKIGWSSVVNPNLGALYLCFFKGPAAAAQEEITLTFNDLWMQYGGRTFTPWASYQGGTDLTFCLGTENAVGAYANGLEYSLSHPELLGSPTVVELAPGEEKSLLYGTLVAEYGKGSLGAGVEQVDATKAGLVIVGRKATGSGKQSFKADAGFTEIAKLVGELG